MKTFQKFLLLSIIFFFVSGFGSAASFAARREKNQNVEDKGDFLLAPSFVSFEGEPGKTYEKEFGVFNRRNRLDKYNVTLQNFEGSQDPNQTIAFIPDPNGSKYGAMSWTKTELKHFELDFGEWQYFNAIIKVPEDAEPGDHHVVILVSREAEDTQPKTAAEKVSESNVKLIGELGAQVVIRVPGPVTSDGKLEKFVTSRKWYDTKPVNFRILYRNDSNIWLAPSGKVVMRDIFGRVSEEIEVNQFRVLRNSLKAQGVTSTTKKFLIGKYTATLSLKRGYGDEQGKELIDTATVSFWFIPWKLLITILLAIIIIIFIIWIIRRKFYMQIGIRRHHRP